MRALESRLYAAGFATALLLCACGGPQGVAAPSSASPLEPATPGRNLFYVSGYFSTSVYTYPHGKLVGALQGETYGLCSNTAGDVFVTSYYGVIDEYQHGQAAPIAQISFPLGIPSGCSVDPRSGKLAVVGLDGGGVSIYRPESQNRWHLPKVYDPAENIWSCGYDASGNLFVDGETQSSVTYLDELPKGGTAFEGVALNVGLTNPGNIEWDGTYLAVGDDANTLIHRYSISGTQGTQEGSVTLSGVSDIGQFWIQGNVLIGPDLTNGDVGFWSYPAGGTATKTIDMRLPSGVTVSIVRGR